MRKTSFGSISSAYLDANILPGLEHIPDPVPENNFRLSSVTVMSWRNEMTSWIKTTSIASISIASALTLAGLVVLIVQGMRPPNHTAQYVALGSSFASGFGLGPRLQGSPYACLKSSNGCPQQLARMLNLSLADMTCYGATTTHVLQ